ncbi:MULTISPECIES: FecCD family ABC transporter permease [unclassified Rathayibacter]|uniref:FecCD family ABC transporter permease n=1 Tax=unclassified Rathayibacter TaxID=2609250 RepID=UPI00188CAD64|nr:MULTISPECIES: iron chelate uptake ABC transporter family permease subunit [unclassified Rathayibacter]MBF4463087.1 iron chelate uptake ABC transporter family permease subunit [Rathayibacter sp. VKM Ac-2879]MBF4504676.1 iron chelate uptake ABC transporter family permease subunit [Rathayibacter sp. VKM Ac-2878]
MSGRTLERAESAGTPAGSVLAGRRLRRRRTLIGCSVLAVIAVALVAIALTFGTTVYSVPQVLRVMVGETVPGASFAVGTLRLPRTLIAVLVGVGFGMGGVIFQTMLRNALASPDIIGITSGASAAAVVAIAFFGLSGGAVSVIAVAAGLAAALLIGWLGDGGGAVGARLILIGIGLAAMFQSVIAYVQTRADVEDVQESLRWLTGSLNSAAWPAVPPLTLAMLVLVPGALVLSGRLGVLQLGDETATALGVDARRSRLALLAVGVGLVAVATAATGPIAFVAFVAGPIARRIVPSARSLLVPSALVGVVVVLAADLLAQHVVGAAFGGARFPVGVVTGALGAPFLLWLLARQNRSGGSL